MEVRIKPSNKIELLIFSFILLLILIFVFCAFGSVDFRLQDIIRSVFIKDNKLLDTIVYDIRLPRNLVAVFVGAGLSVSGLLLQAVMKNPLADPGLTGVSSGAGVFAIIILLVFPYYSYFLPIFAFLGGMLACILVYVLAWKNGEIQPTRIILSGVAINAIFGSIISFLTIMYSDRIQGALLWLNGNLSSKTWADFRLISLYLTFGLIFSFFCIRPANVLALGEKTALSLGFNVNKLRILMSVIAVFLAGICTSIVGIIGFVGLIVPHLSRLIIGDDYKYCLPLSISLGGITVLTADTIARTIGGEVELPVGIIMSLLGGPFFLYLLRKKGGE